MRQPGRHCVGELDLCDQAAPRDFSNASAEPDLGLRSRPLDTSLNAGYIQAMKIAAQARNRKAKVNFRSQTFTLSSAKTYLGRLVEKASRGEAVYIITGRRRFVLQEVPEIEPIPMRPAGYFANAYSRAEIQADNSLAKASVVRAPKDLE